MKSQRIVGKHTRVFRVRRFCRRAGVALGAAFLWGSLALLYVGAMAAGHLSATFSLAQAVAFGFSPIFLGIATLLCRLSLSVEQQRGLVHVIAHKVLRFLPYSGDRRVAELCDSVLVFAATSFFAAASLGPMSLLIHHPHPLGPMAVISCHSAGATCAAILVGLALALWLQFERIDRRSLVVNGEPLDIDLDDAAQAGPAAASSMSRAGTGQVRQRLKPAAAGQAGAQRGTDVAAGATAATDDEVEASVSSLFLGAPAASLWLRESLRCSLLCLLASAACLAVYAAAGGRIVSLYIAILAEGGWKELMLEPLFAAPAVLDSIAQVWRR